MNKKSMKVKEMADMLGLKKNRFILSATQRLV